MTTAEVNRYIFKPTGPFSEISQVDAIKWLYKQLGHVPHRAQAAIEKVRRAAMTPESSKGRSDPTVSPGVQGSLKTTEASPLWLKVSEAAKIANTSSGVISRAVDAGHLKSNGKRHRERRIDSADVSRWILERSICPEPVESDQKVERLARRAGLT